MNQTIENNSAGNTGGGAHFFTDTSTSEVVIVDSGISSNQASKAGGLSSFGENISIAIRDSNLRDNKSFDTPEMADCGGVGFDIQSNNLIDQKNNRSN